MNKRNFKVGDIVECNSSKSIALTKTTVVVTKGKRYKVLGTEGIFVRLHDNNGSESWWAMSRFDLAPTPKPTVYAVTLPEFFNSVKYFQHLVREAQLAGADFKPEPVAKMNTEDATSYPFLWFSPTGKATYKEYHLCPAAHPGSHPRLSLEEFQVKWDEFVRSKVPAPETFRHYQVTATLSSRGKLSFTTESGYTATTIKQLKKELLPASFEQKKK